MLVEGLEIGVYKGIVLTIGLTFWFNINKVIFLELRREDLNFWEYKVCFICNL